MSKAIAVIPARYASTRLPGKPLLDRTGKPMVVHCADQARKAKSLSDVIVATDDPRIVEAVTRHGHRAAMTDPAHPNGTCRIEEVARTLPADISLIVNVQGDEPMIDPAVIDRLVDRLRAGSEPMATIASPFGPAEDPTNPNIVKVVVTQTGRALYFSRSLIPFNRDGDANAVQPLKHIGLYAYRREFLPTYVNLAPTPCENAEKLEQLRVLEHGHPIAVVQATVHHVGIDTPEQYEAFVNLWHKTHA
jgi:3-deoxy-manno-octulosonate cytidylyltransferase (CMP-KDO synthetase)